MVKHGLKHLTELLRKNKKLLKWMVLEKVKYQEIFMKNILVKNLYLLMQQIVYYKMHILKQWKSLN